MTDALVQLGIAAFGLTALWMAMGHNPTHRKWAPVIGLAGQAFWTAFAWQTKAWGLAALVVAYTAVYARGAWVQWRTSGVVVTHRPHFIEHTAEPSDGVKEDGNAG
jgi:hypothetical protein